jgi:hypothetical protein
VICTYFGVSLLYSGVAILCLSLAPDLGFLCFGFWDISGLSVKNGDSMNGIIYCLNCESRSSNS